MSGNASGGRPRSSKNGRYIVPTWRDDEQPNEPVLASGYRLTARELEVLDLLILAHGTRKVVARRLGISPQAVEYHTRKAGRKLGLGSPLGTQAMLYRAKMLGAIEALNGMRHHRGYPIRDLYEASIQLGPDHPLFEYLNPPRLINGTTAVGATEPLVHPRPERLKRNEPRASDSAASE